MGVLQNEILYELTSAVSEQISAHIPDTQTGALSCEHVRDSPANKSLFVTDY